MPRKEDELSDAGQDVSEQLSALGESTDALLIVLLSISVGPIAGESDVLMGHMALF